jgi:LacI family transcriptional regulator
MRVTGVRKFRGKYVCDASGVDTCGRFNTVLELSRRPHETPTMSNVTLLEIARRLGVSKTAVSLALRNKPGLSAETKQRIVKLAEELGYAPNPLSVELMALVRDNRQKSAGQTIAFFNTFMDPGLMKRIEGFPEFVTGAALRAERYGYKVEVFEARSPGMTGARLADILQARGIRGILVGPRWGQEPEMDFPWERFSVVLVGEPEYGKNLHRVCNHHIHACSTALRNLAAKGYRNIGVALAAIHERSYGYDYLLGVDQFVRQCGSNVKVTPWLYEEWSHAEGKKWVKAHDFDAGVSLSGEPANLFLEMRTRGGEPLGLPVCLRSRAEPGRASASIPRTSARRRWTCCADCCWAVSEEPRHAHRFY